MYMEKLCTPRSILTYEYDDYSCVIRIIMSLTIPFIFSNNFVNKGEAQ